MSKLTEALEFICRWAQQHNRKDYKPLRSGLTLDAIEAMVKDLLFKIPTEVYELYQWRNSGVYSFLPDANGEYGLQVFLTLDEAVDTAENWNMNLFPLFSSEDVMYFIVGQANKEETAPVFSNDTLQLPDSADYPSLTAMLEEQVERLRSKG